MSELDPSWKGKIALLTRERPPFSGVSALLERTPSVFVAVQFLAQEHVASLRSDMPTSTELGVWLPAECFDPPEDHPLDPEFTWTKILLHDFSDLNEDIGTVAGVTHGDFARLLDWQPRIDRNRTTLIAIVAPGPWNRTLVKEKASIPLLARALRDNGYDAIAINCKTGDDADFEMVATYAAEMRSVASIPMLYVSKARRQVESPFFMGIHEA